MAAADYRLWSGAVYSQVAGVSSASATSAFDSSSAAGFGGDAVNRYVFLHRITGPVILLVFGVTALLDTWHVMSYGESWPLYLIAIGLLQLAKRAAWAQLQVPPVPPSGYSGYPGAGNYPPYQGPQLGSYQPPATTDESRRAGWDTPRGLDGEEGGKK